LKVYIFQGSYPRVYEWLCNSGITVTGNENVKVVFRAYLR